MSLWFRGKNIPLRIMSILHFSEINTLVENEKCLIFKQSSVSLKEAAEYSNRSNGPFLVKKIGVNPLQVTSAFLFCDELHVIMSVKTMTFI